MRKIYGRRDFAIIGELIEPRTRVLDLGCGEGELLAWLKENKQVDGRGVELEGARVQKAIARGASVYQGDLESAGFTDVVVEAIDAPLRMSSTAECLDFERESFGAELQGLVERVDRFSGELELQLNCGAAGHAHTLGDPERSGD